MLGRGYDSLREVIVERRPDSGGAESHFVWLLLDDKVTDADLDWDVIRPMHEDAHRQMLNWYEDYYPYVRVRRVREDQEMLAA